MTLQPEMCADEYYSYVRIIYKDNQVVGYTHSEAEADAICEKDGRFQWDVVRKKNENLIKRLPQLTIHDVISQY
jgi:hypothetical protein